MADQQLYGVIEECASKAGAHVIDLVVRGEHAHAAVDVFVDAEDGITAEICTALNRDIMAALDLHGVVKPPYTLTVSSPGIARPLKFLWQYRKHVGRFLEVKVKSGSDLRAESGTLVAVDDKSVSLQVKGKGEHAHIDFEAIVEAKVKAPW
jgi:ribosome maturation factor RimP